MAGKRKGDESQTPLGERVPSAQRTTSVANWWKSVSNPSRGTCAFGLNGIS